MVAEDVVQTTPGVDDEVSIKDLQTSDEVTAALVAVQALVVPPSDSVRRLSEELWWANQSNHTHLNCVMEIVFNLGANLLTESK